MFLSTVVSSQRWTRVGSVALVGVLAILLFGAAHASATFPGANGRIAYTDDDRSIHTVLPSGHGDTMIAPYGFQVAWSPNGKRLLFVGGTEANIYTVRADGSGMRQLTFDGDNYRPSYSPGGGRIVFTHSGFASVGATTMLSDGSDRHLIAKDHGAWTWAPDGEIVYNDAGGIWAMRPDGDQQHRLIRNGSSPIYSPDGSEFLFSRARDDDDTVYHLLADGDGSNIRPPPCRVLSRASTRPAGGLFPRAYSPDGKWLLVDSPNQYPQPTENVVRLSLGSCTGKRVVGRVAQDGADWQPVPNG